MAKKINRSIRLSQVVSNYGVGALYDILGESLVLTDTRNWDDHPYHGQGKEITAERLLETLRSTPGYFNVKGLYEPAKKDSRGSLPFLRFPRWLFCAKCRRMKQWRYEDEAAGESPVCPFCDKNPRLTPMRFITICELGHMGDVDWIRWAHSRQNAEHQKTCQARDLEFITGNNKSGGLGSLAVRCRSCGAQRSLEGITTPDALKSVGAKCSGRQPWQRMDNAIRCESRIHVVQRGAGNVYYPQIKSALTIPPESRYREADPDDLKTRIFRQELAKHITITENTEFVNAVASKIAANVKCSKEKVLAIILGSRQGAETSDEAHDLEGEEWTALIKEIAEADDRDKFVTRHIDMSAGNPLPELPRCIDKLVSVIKLREVRALTGFFRYHPGGIEEDVSITAIRPDLDGSLEWLPAAEAFGEGVFLTLNETTLRQWEESPEVRNRAALLEGRTGDSRLAHFLPDATPRFILLHTLAHLLIRRLAFECGYSSASLRERIYSAVPGEGRTGKAGILIYTAAGDSEGTLGGLARQADSERFRETLLSALQDAANCSADPICMESKGQGLGSLNLAACHACTLVSETSCTSFNLILDRAMVTGGSGVRGFFQNLLEYALQSTITTALNK